MTTLSSEEINTVRGLITQHRKFERQWRVLRWAVLGVALLSLAMAVWGYHRMCQFQKITTTSHIVADPSPENIGHVLDARVVLLRREFRNYSSTILYGSMGGLMLGMVLIGWNRLGQWALLRAKLLEAALENTQTSDIASELIKAVDA
jgi:hypothetical protein